MALPEAAADRTTTAGVVNPSRVARPGEDSEFYLIERRLEALGLGRRPWEPVLSWLDRVRSTPVEGVRTAELAAAATLHYRYRFDPKGLAPGSGTRYEPLSERGWTSIRPRGRKVGGARDRVCPLHCSAGQNPAYEDEQMGSPGLEAIGSRRPDNPSRPSGRLDSCPHLPAASPRL